MLIVAIVVGLVVSQMAIFLTTVFLHRTLSHRAISLSPGLTMVFRVLIWITTGIRPRQWVAVHRRHHAFTDVEGDPHSPLLDGFWKVQLTNAVMYRRVAREPDTVSRYARDIPPDRWDRLFFDHALVGLGIGVTILWAIFGWKLALVAAAVHVYTYLGLNAAINAVGHRFGSQPYENTARNNQWLALITAGEGLHNNHHAASTSAKLALGAHEIDPGWWFVRLLQKRRWAAVRHSEIRFRSVKAPVEEPAA
ncbi:MAG: fatty acid desaturase [Acidimicrobiales bacterium]